MADTRPTLALLDASRLSVLLTPEPARAGSSTHSRQIRTFWRRMYERRGDVLAPYRIGFRSWVPIDRSCRSSLHGCATPRETAR